MNNFLYVIIIIIFVIIIEYVSISLIKSSVKNKNSNYILGILLYIVVGWLLYKLYLKYNLLSSRFLISRIFIILVPLLIVYILEETFTFNKKIGLLFIIFGIFILEYNNIKKIMS
jgi:uncharacterized membrane protein